MPHQKGSRGSPGGTVVKNLPANAGHARDAVSGLGRSLGEGNSNSKDREDWQATSMGSQRVRHDSAQEKNWFFFFFRKVQIRRAFRNPNGPPFTVRSTFQQENVWHRQSHLEQAYEDSDLQLLKGDSVLSLCTPRWPVLAVVIPKLKSHLIRSLESPWIVQWQSQFFLPPVEFFFLMFLFEFSFYHLSVSYRSLLQIHSNYVSWKSDSSYHLQIVVKHIFSTKLATKWIFLMQYNLCMFLFQSSDFKTCLLRNLYAGQEATVRTGHGTTDWF